MNMVVRLFFAFGLVSLVSACASTEDTTSTVEVNDTFKSIPAWVLNPSPEQGLGAASCVVYSGNLSVDQKVAVSNARVALAQQLQTKVEALEKNYLQRQDVDQQNKTGVSFEAVSKSITSESLTGSKADKFGIATINGKDHYCAHVVMDEQQSQLVFNQALSASSADLNQTEKDFMYQEFKAHKAEQSLEQALAEYN